MPNASLVLSVILCLPLVGAIVVALLPKSEPEQCRHMGMFFGIVTFLVSLGLLLGFKFSGSAAEVGGMQFVERILWIKAWGIYYHLGVDGISLWLVILTTFLSPVVLLSTYQSVTHKVKELVIALLLLEMGMIGAFISLDLILFYVFWEIMLIPMYVIIGIWGHERRVYAAIKFVLYTLVGSLLMLVAIIYMYMTHGQATGEYTFDYMVLTQSVWGQQAQLWLYFAFALAFAIKVPMFPLHTWLPDAHVEAPTAGSVILAGVLLKMGTYGFLRFAIPLFPWAAAVFAPYVTALAVIGIVYGALVAWAQKDAKKLVAYSSVSHLGFVMLGLMAMNATGIQGGIYQMLNHGISTGGLFLAIGVLYDRRHTRLLAQFGGLWKQMPVFGGVFMLVMLSSAGLPGLNGFVGEFLILVGAFTHHSGMQTLGLTTVDGATMNFMWMPHVTTAIAATGLILGAVYLLHLMQKLMFGPITQKKNESLSDLNTKEIWSFVPLIALIFAMGIYPKPFLERMEPSVKLFLSDYKLKFDESKAYTAALPKRIAGMSHRQPTTPRTFRATGVDPAGQGQARAAGQGGAR